MSIFYPAFQENVSEPSDSEVVYGLLSTGINGFLNSYSWSAMLNEEIG